MDARVICQMDHTLMTPTIGHYCFYQAFTNIPTWVKISVWLITVCCMSGISIAICRNHKLPSIRKFSKSNLNFRTTDHQRGIKEPFQFCDYTSQDGSAKGMEQSVWLHRSEGQTWARGIKVSFDKLHQESQDMLCRNYMIRCRDKNMIKNFT